MVSTNPDVDPATDDAARLAALFGGDRANGYDPATMRKREDGKIKPEAHKWTKAPTRALWQQHLDGKIGLGIMPPRKDGKVLFGSIDVDIYDDSVIDRATIIEQVYRDKLGLVPCRTKSGGLRLFLLAAQPVDAELMERALRNLATRLGLVLKEAGGSTELLVTSNTWMPYVGGESPAAVKKRGLHMTVGEFLRAAEKARLSTDAVAELAKPPAKKNGAAGGTTTNDGSRYAARRLKDYCDKLAAMADGDGRNAFLNKALHQMGRMVGAGWIERDRIERDLKQVADAIGMDRQKTEGMLRRRKGKSAIDKGMMEPPPDITTRGDFACNGKGDIVGNSQANVRLALDRLDAKLRHDMFQDNLLVEGVAGVGPLLDDRAVAHLWLAIDEKFGFRPQKEFFLTVITDAARRSAFHPVCDYLDGLKWDGSPRIDTWLTKYAGAQDTPYVGAVGRLVLVAAVRRVRHPGSKFDELLVLESKQGTDKSSALAILAVNDDWFSDDLPLGADGKRVIESLSGRWIVEAAELKGMKRGDIESLKAFLSRRIDRARMSYDRLVTVVPRQCVIIGTTNSAEYLRDNTGNRRFWPVKVVQFDLDNLRRDRDQLWAEAAAAEAAGESIRLDKSLWLAAADEQRARTVEDPFVETISSALGDLEGKVLAADVWDLLDLRPGHRTQDHNARVGEAMKELGFGRTKLRFGGEKEWAYARGDKNLRIYFHRDENGRFLYASNELDKPVPGEGDGGDSELPF
jgi:Virulence-associated protein E